MRVLIVHHETEYFAGAEKMLGYFLTGLTGSGPETTVATARESRVRELIPSQLSTCWIPSNARFSLLAFVRQARALRRAFAEQPFDVVHGWAARDWELVALTARLTGTPGMGTLHDHPKAGFISPARRRLMAWSAATSLRRVVCVSEAVRVACLAAGYSPDRLRVVRNGLPSRAWAVPRARDAGRFRLGFLGLFSERKGLRGLFRIADELSKVSAVPWELGLAGDAQDEAGRKLVGELKAEFSTRRWWPWVNWRGWVKDPAEFLSSIDVLICPSSEFDPFPTVLLEAGQAGVPVVAARVGGVEEIVEDERTGWLFEPQAWRQAALKLKTVLESPGLTQESGHQAKKRVEAEFAMERMVADYLRIYHELSKK
jgi:glycosyltransferase involved in cell wall biosynthesis